MDRAPRSFFLIAFFVFLSGLAPVSWTKTAPELETILQRIESRHYRWIAIRADVLLFFAKPGNPNAVCDGQLLYQRLEERMLLSCVDARQELLFVFRTFDRRFDLYLPSQKTVYHGSIFDMEDSPEIESHLKARDLYRALKPTAVDPRRAQVERINSAITSLNVYSRDKNGEIPVRKLYLTPEGDVRGELFYNSKGQPVTEIRRYDFRKFRDWGGSHHSMLFPKKITVLSSETKKESALFFKRVTALDTLDPLEFILRLPPGIHEVFLKEKDPRLQNFKKAEKAAAPLPRPMPVEKPVEISKPPPPKELVPPAEEKSEKSTNQNTANSNAPDPSYADITEENTRAEPSDASDAQTTLDPYVEPSLEMGKR